MKREDIDLTEVRKVHAEIHERLLNWARWCRSGGGGASMLPMFQGYRNGYEETRIPPIPVDSLDGHRVEKLVVALPDKHRTVLQWWYVRPYIPVRRVCQAIGARYAEVHELVHAARSMLKNRS